MSAPTIEAAVLNYLRTLEIPESQIELAIARLQAELEAEQEKNRPELERLRRAIREVEREKEAVMEMLLSAGRSINDGIRKMANERMEKADLELLGLQERLLTLETPDNTADELTVEALNIARSMKRITGELEKGELDPVHTRQVILGNIERIELTPEGDYLIVPVEKVRLTVQNGSPARIRTSTK